MLARTVNGAHKQGKPNAENDTIPKVVVNAIDISCHTKYASAHQYKCNNDISGSFTHFDLI